MLKKSSTTDSIESSSRVEVVHLVSGATIIGVLLDENKQGVVIGKPLLVQESDLPGASGVTLVPMDPYTDQDRTKIGISTIVYHNPIGEAMREFYMGSLEYIEKIHEPAFKEAITRVSSYLRKALAEVASGTEAPVTQQEKTPAEKKRFISVHQVHPGSNTYQ